MGGRTTVDARISALSRRRSLTKIKAYPAPLLRWEDRLGADRGVRREPHAHAKRERGAKLKQGGWTISVISVISVYTEMTDTTKTALTPIQQKFILHWGEMGARWGINRTVAQIHALLFLSRPPAQRRGDRRRRSASRDRTSATACASCRAGASSASPTCSATGATTSRA